ncbi:hypothetical protein C475_21494 [Halosimplex carlsbadense 2-9-1]|uniref:Phasin domain-containing protein n=1 Tax=Halosimplex carlsbadense 2-9-1 TaxID=797114 RepID=M0C9K1_9EURY|nr:hypothetical protein [Halosimplex carlsbadense]ELZ19915.1 hypothetical protein C475_21494 [Halosimplex carlsbadense 2-9-1]
MSQTDQLVSKAIELQRNTLENSQRAMEQAVELPLQQSVALQRNAAQLVLDGLEMGNWLGTQSVEFTRDAMDSYLDAVESAARDTSELTERGIQRAEMAGERGLESTQRFASGFAGDGPGPRTDASGAGAPPGYRTPAEAVAASAPQGAPNPEPPATDGQQTGYATPAARSQMAPARSSQPQQQRAQATPPQGMSMPASPSQQAPPQQAPMQAPPQQAPMQAPPQQAPMQAPPQQAPMQAPPQQISPQASPQQQAPPGQPPSGQIQAQSMPAQQGPTGPPSQGPTPVGQRTRRPQTPSKTGQTSTSDGPVAEGAAGRPTPDSKPSAGQPAAAGESEREAETPADNA